MCIFVDRCLSFCTFSFGHCVVCSSSIYRFWLPLWYLRTPRTDIINKKTTAKNKAKTQRQNNTKIIYMETKSIPWTRIYVADYFPRLVKALSLKGGRVKQTWKPEGQSLMENPSTLATLGTQDTLRRQTKHKIRWATWIPQKSQMNPVACEE
jgi:hypothetical protein